MRVGIRAFASALTGIGRSWAWARPVIEPNRIVRIPKWRIVPPSSRSGGIPRLHRSLTVGFQRRTAGWMDRLPAALEREIDAHVGHQAAGDLVETHAQGSLDEGLLPDLPASP